MNKAEIINAMSVRYGHTKKESTRQLDEVLDVILHSIPKGGVKLRGFGTFDVVERKAKTFNNPNTKESTFIPKRRVVTFIPSDRLRNMVKDSGDSHE